MGRDLYEWNFTKVAIQFEARRCWYYGFCFIVQCTYDGNFGHDGLLIPRLHAMMGSDRSGMDTDMNGMDMERYSDRPDPSGSL